LLFEDSLPDWYDGKRINEVLFCQQFLDKHPMNFAPWMQLMQDAVPADTTEKPEESEDMDAALDFADSF